MRETLDRFLINPVTEELKRFSSVSGVNDDEKIKSAIILAQDLDLPLVLNYEDTDLITDADVLAFELSEEIEDPSEKEKFHNLLVKCLAHYAVARLVESFSMAYTESGLYNDANSANLSQTQDFVQKERMIADSYGNKIRDFISNRLGETDDFYGSEVKTNILTTKFKAIGGTNQWSGNI